MKKHAGLTLLEVLIASAILVVVVLLAMSALFSSTSAATKGSISSDLEERGQRFLAVLRDDMSMAQYNPITATTTPNPPGTAPVSPVLMGYYGAGYYDTAVGFRIPGAADANGNSAAVSSGTLVYGYNSPLGSPNNGFFQDLVCVIRFEADTEYKESAASLDAAQAPNMGAPFPNYPLLTKPTPPTQILNLDLNRDGDQTDTFVTGKIVRYVIALPSNTKLLAATGGPPGLPEVIGREVLSDQAIFRVAGPSAGQFNGDLEACPTAPQYAGPTNSGVLFGFVGNTGVYPPPASPPFVVSTNGRGLLVSVWHGSVDDTGKAWILRHNQLLIRFRIPQS